MPDPARAWAFLENSDLVCGEQEIQSAIARLAAEIAARLRDAYPVVLVVMGGAVVFAGQLLPRLRFPLDLDYVHATRYGAATAGGGIAWRVSPPEDVRGRTVLLRVPDRVVFGCAMDAKGFWRNLPEIRAMRAA